MSNSHLPTDYQEYIARSRYARFLPKEKRRETWKETVQRYVDFFSEKHPEIFPSTDIYNAIHDLNVMPSMRALMTAGKALERDMAGGYNCSYLAVDDPRAFDECLYLLMVGSGVGFSVERQVIAKLPTVSEEFHPSSTMIKVRDSKIGWASSYRELIAMLYAGQVPKWDLSSLRESGAPLKTFGGRSSGPAPLNELFENTVRIFKNAAGRKLTSLECHDIMNFVGSAVVVGGVRRCLPSGSKVHTKIGMIDIEDIEVGDMVLTSDGYYPVTNKFDQGRQELVRVTTQDSSFDCTPNHKIAVLNGMNSYVWKRADELDTCDRIIGSSFSVDGIVTALPEFNYIKPKHSTTCKDITIPDFDVDMAWLLGLMQGDGYVRLTSKAGEVCIACTKTIPEIIEKAETQIRRFGVNASRVEYDNYLVIRCKSKQLASYFHSWLKQARVSLNVPSFIWEATYDIKMSYVAGLMDADGYASGRPPQVCCTVYPDYAKQIQLLLASCGVQTRINILFRSSADFDKGWQQKYSVVAVNTKTKEALNEFGVKQINISGVEQRTNSFPKEWLSFPYANNYPWSKTDSKFIPVSIVSVEKIAEVEQTWDIEVDTMHEFYCNGYLMHNSAQISLSNLSDERMRSAKSGQWWVDNGQRALANNSVAYTEKPDVGVFMDEWKSLYASRSGERGLFNRQAAIAKMKKNGRRDCKKYEESNGGVNPCGEIFLRNNGLCNLSESVIRSNDTLEDVLKKVEIAAIMGTFQSSLTNFRYLRAIWRKNAEEERLLGISLTGIMDHPILSTVNDEAILWLSKMKEHAVETNRIWAEKLGINQATAVTCCKPSGTVSQLVDSASGIHARYSPYYIRTVRSDKSDPIGIFMKEQGIPCEDDITKPDKTWVFSFPMKSPDGARIASEMTAIEQLNHYLMFYDNWAEHTVSITVYVRENEWLDVGAWVFKHFDEIGGISFLPYSSHSYKQAPYQPISEEEYNQIEASTPKLDWSLFNVDEHEDVTTGSQTFACSGNTCELV